MYLLVTILPTVITGHYGLSVEGDRFAFGDMHKIERMTSLSQVMS